MLIASCGSDAQPDNAPLANPPVPAPVVNGMTPSSGPYGTELVIDGEGFGELALLLDFTEGDGTIRQFEASQWTDRQIRARIQFPALGTGEVSFCSFTNAVIRAPGCSSGQSRIRAGTFSVASEWQRGNAQEFWGDVLAARVFSDGSVAAVSTGRGDLKKSAHLVRFGEGGFTPQPISGLRTRPHRVVLLESADGRPEVVTTSSQNEILHHRWAGEALEATQIGIPGSVVADGSDEGGRFVWVSHEATLSRRRIDADWAVDRSVGGGARTAALTADGSLVAAVVSRVGNILDYRYRLNVVSLAPEASAFEPLGEASLHSHDGIPWVDIQVSAGGEVVLVAYCAEEDGASMNCDHRRVRNATGEWSDVPALPSGAQLAVGERSLAIAFADERGVIVWPDLYQPEDVVLPVWPASPVALLPFGNELRVLVRDAFDLYAPHLAP